MSSPEIHSRHELSQFTTLAQFFSSFFSWHSICIKRKLVFVPNNNYKLASELYQYPFGQYILKCACSENAATAHLPDVSVFLESEPVWQWLVLFDFLSKHNLLPQALCRLYRTGISDYILQKKIRINIIHQPQDFIKYSQ